MKSDASPKHFHLRNDRADLKLKASKQIFTSTCHNLTPVNSECVREKKARVHFRKISVTGQIKYNYYTKRKERKNINYSSCN